MPGNANPPPAEAEPAKAALIAQILQVQSGADPDAMTKEQLEAASLEGVQQRAAVVRNSLVGELHAAAMCGDAAWIERLLACPLIDIDASAAAEPKGDTIDVYVSSKPGDTSVRSTRALSPDADCRHQGKDLLVEGIGAGTGAGWSALHQAVDGSQLEAVTTLLRAGADPNKSTQFGSTPLFWVHSSEIARLLLVFGANPNLVDREHHTAQQWHERMCSCKRDHHTGEVARCSCAQGDVARTIKALQNPKHVLEEAQLCNSHGESWLAHRLCDLGLRFFVVADASAAPLGAASQRVRHELEELRRATAGTSGLELHDIARLEQRALLAAVDVSIKPDIEQVRELLITHLRRKWVKTPGPQAPGDDSQAHSAEEVHWSNLGQVPLETFDKAFVEAMESALIWRKAEGSLSDLPQQVDVAKEMDRERLLQICREENMFEVYQEDTVNAGRWVMKRDDDWGDPKSKLPELALIHKQLNAAILEHKEQRKHEEHDHGAAAAQDLSTTTANTAHGTYAAAAEARLRAEAEAELSAVQAEAAAEEAQHEREMGSALDELEQVKAELTACRRQIATCLESEAYLQSKLAQSESRGKKLRANCKKLSRELSVREVESSKTHAMLHEMIQSDRILSQRLETERRAAAETAGGAAGHGGGGGPGPVAEERLASAQAQLHAAQTVIGAQDALIAEMSLRLADGGWHEGDDDSLRLLRKKVEKARKQEKQSAHDNFDALLHQRKQKVESLAHAWDRAAEEDGYRRGMGGRGSRDI